MRFYFRSCVVTELRTVEHKEQIRVKSVTQNLTGVCVLQVLLCASNQSGSIVECWSLRKEGLPVNNIFQHRSPVGKTEQKLVKLVLTEMMMEDHTKCWMFDL